MRLQQFLCKTVLVLLILILPSGPSQSATEEPMAILLAGKSDQYGAVQFKICNRAINIVDNLGMALWLPAQPNLSMTLNGENHTYLVNQLEDGRLGEMEGGRRHFRPVCKAELLDKPILLGQHCLHYRGYRKSHFDESLQPAVDFWCLEKNTFAPAVNRAWCSLFLLPADYGFPIQVMSCPGARRWAHTFSVAKFERVPVKMLVLKLPPQYKEAKDKGALFFGKDGVLKSSDLDDLFRSK